MNQYGEPNLSKFNILDDPEYIDLQRRLISAKCFTPHKVAYYEERIKEVQETYRYFEKN